MNISYHDARHILDLKDTNIAQKAVLFALLTHMHPGTKRIHPSYATLGEELGCDERTVIRHVKALSKSGLIQIRKEPYGGRICNTYVVPFSDGYSYKSEQNDPSVPKPDSKSNDAAKPKAKSEPTEDEWDAVCEKIVYTTPIPSVFVDIAFEDIQQMAFVDAMDKRITPKSLQSHIARMWKHCKEKPFYAALERVWDKHWQNIHDGLYDDKNGKRDSDKEHDGLDQLKLKHGVNWENTNEHNEMHAPFLGFTPVYRFYPDKYKKRKANKVINPPLGLH